MSENNGSPPKFGVRKNVKLVGRTDIAGGGQVVVDNGYAYTWIRRIARRSWTSKIPRTPRSSRRSKFPRAVHSHKVRVSGDIMLVNLERYCSKEKQPSGLKIYDVSNKEKPKEYQPTAECIASPSTGYAYISAHIEGYVGRIPMILDLKDRRNPKEVGRWWMPGQ